MALTQISLEAHFVQHDYTKKTNSCSTEHSTSYLLPSSNHERHILTMFIFFINIFCGQADSSDGHFIRILIANNSLKIIGSGIQRKAHRSTGKTKNNCVFPFHKWVGTWDCILFKQPPNIIVQAHRNYYVTIVLSISVTQSIIWVKILM